MSTLNHQELLSLCQAAKKAAIAAGHYIQSQFDQHYEKQHKEGGESLASQVVTAVDFKAQEIILEHLQDSIKNHDLGLLTEETADDESRTKKAYFWCIDPMDGTLPFTEHRTGYSVSIALISNAGDPVTAVVYIPDLKKCYSAIKSAGLMLNDQPFAREESLDEGIHFYMDQSFQSAPHYEEVLFSFEQYADNRGLSVQFHSDFGGVRNAIGVMSSGKGCYFKFPRNRKGCGSIWDYAATRLFFEELELCVSNSIGEPLHLNKSHTTFMNEEGILYATDLELKEFVVGLQNSLK